MNIINKITLVALESNFHILSGKKESHLAMHATFSVFT